jgi:hypothetical protein
MSRQKVATLDRFVYVAPRSSAFDLVATMSYKLRLVAASKLSRTGEIKRRAFRSPLLAVRKQYEVLPGNR